MKHHIELCRQIMLKLDHSDHFPMDGCQDSDIQVNGYNAFEIAWACKDLVDFGYLDGTVVAIGNAEFIVFIHDFHKAGLAFLNHARSENVWNDFKETVRVSTGQVTTFSVKFMLTNFSKNDQFLSTS